MAIEHVGAFVSGPTGTEVFIQPPPGDVWMVTVLAGSSTGTHVTDGTSTTQIGNPGVRVDQISINSSMYVRLWAGGSNAPAAGYFGVKL